MTYVYTCSEQHETELFNVRVADKPINMPCSKCERIAWPAVTAPQGHMLFGRPEGYDKPSALKRSSYKTVNREGNPR